MSITTASEPAPDPTRDTGTYDSVYSCSVPSIDLALLSGGQSLTLTEICVFLPQSIKNGDVSNRLFKNDVNRNQISNIMSFHLMVARGGISPNLAMKWMQGGMRKITGNRSWTARKDVPQMNRANWNFSDLTLTGARLNIQHNPPRGTRRVVINNVPLSDLGQHVRVMPQGADALDLTRCVEYAMVHPEEDLQFPRDFDAMVIRLGSQLVTSEHHDGAVAARWSTPRPLPHTQQTIVPIFQSTQVISNDEIPDGRNSSHLGDPTEDGQSRSSSKTLSSASRPLTVAPSDTTPLLGHDASMEPPSQSWCDPLYASIKKGQSLPDVDNPNYIVPTSQREIISSGYSELDRYSLTTSEVPEGLAKAQQEIRRLRNLLQERTLEAFTPTSKRILTETTGVEEYDLVKRSRLNDSVYSDNNDSQNLGQLITGDATTDYTEDQGIPPVCHTYAGILLRARQVNEVQNESTTHFEETEDSIVPSFSRTAPSQVQYEATLPSAVDDSLSMPALFGEIMENGVSWI